MTDTIFFDLDNTLLDFSRAERAALSKTLEALGVPPAEDLLHRYSQLNAAQWRLLEQGKLTRPEVKLRRFRLLFAEYGIPAAPGEATKIYESHLGVGHFFMEGAEELLEALAGRYRLYLVTNGTAAVQKGRIESAGLKNRFAGIFISEEVGFDKPDPAFFHYCFGQIPGFRKENAVIVGDSLTSDIKGGLGVGLRTIWFNPSHAANPTDIVPDHEIGRLLDLPLYLCG